MPVVPRRRIATLLSSLAVLAVPAAADAAPGDLDPSFDGDGRVVLAEHDLGPVPGGVALARDGQGRLLVGYGRTAAGSFGVRRLGADGATDTSFGQGGDSTMPAFSAGITGLAVAPFTGRVIATGNGAESSDATTMKGHLSDFGADGAQDGGWAPWKLFEIDGHRTFPHGAVVQPDGKVVVVGDVSLGAENRGFVARFTQGGALDPTFGDGADGAYVAGGPAGTGTMFNAVALAADGAIVVAGESYDTGSHVLVGRFTAGGVPDTAFGGGDGFVSYAVGEDTGYGGSYATGVVVTDAGIVATGRARAGERNGLAAIRLTATGALDAAFGSGGATILTSPSDHVDPGGSGVDASGRILLAGSVNTSGRWAIGRLTAAGRADASFGTGGLATVAAGDVEPSHASDLVVAGDKALLAGSTTVGGRTVPAVIRVQAGDGPAQGGAQQQEQAQPQQEQPQQQQPATDTVKVKGVDFTVVASTERTIDVPDFSRGRFHWTSGYAIMSDRIPYLDLSWEFDDQGCQGQPEGNISKQTPAAGRFLISPEKPLKMRWKICLDTDELAKTCAAKKITKSFKKNDDYALYDAVLEEIRRCKVDYDVKFTKKVDTPDFKPVKNVKAPAPKKGQDPPKRKPIEAAIECSTSPQAQALNLIWTEGASSGASYSLHASHPQLGWTIPAGVTSLFKLQVGDKAEPMNLLRAKVFFDTDAVGAAKIAPRVIDGRGETFFNVMPRKSGLIRVCAVYEAGNGVVSATAAIRVVDEPKAGSTWETIGGRRLAMTRNGPRQVAGFGGASARAAWSLGDAWNALVSLFGGRVAAVNQVASSPQTPAKKVGAVARSGYGLAQLGNGGTLGAMPGLPSLSQGTVYTNLGGRLGLATGSVITKNPGGTLLASGQRAVAAGGANVVAAGGANVVAAGGMNLLSDNGLGVVSAGGGNVVAAGGMNLIGHAGGNVVAAGGGNVVAAGGMN